MAWDVAPVVAAQALLRHGLSDEVIVGYVARTWPLDDAECRAAVRAAHILFRRGQATLATAGDGYAPPFVDIKLSGTSAATPHVVSFTAIGTPAAAPVGNASRIS